MTTDQKNRHAKFLALYRKLPGANTEKIALVRSILHCAEITVRIYCMDSPTRVIPEAKLKILQDGLARAGLANK